MSVDQQADNHLSDNFGFLDYAHVTWSNQIGIHRHIDCFLLTLLLVFTIMRSYCR